MLENIFQDWTANTGNPKGRLVLCLFRMASLCSQLPRAIRWIAYPYVLIYRILVEWILGIEIPWKTRIGTGLRVYHGQALVINDRAEIGRNCILRNSTTIGVAITDSTYGGEAPRIGDNVDVGAHVVIIGDITVGANSVIGAGAVVIRNVPPNSVVVGNPGRVIRTVEEL